MLVFQSVIQSVMSSLSQHEGSGKARVVVVVPSLVVEDVRFRQAARASCRARWAAVVAFATEHFVKNRRNTIFKACIFFFLVGESDDVQSKIVEHC